MNTIAENVGIIATAAVVNMNVANTLGLSISPNDALDRMCTAYVKDADDADKRTGRFMRYTTREEIANVGWLAATATDILNGKIERPSVGNVRAYAIKLMVENLIK